MHKMAFSAHKRLHHHLSIPSGTTAAPPPTPSSHPNNLLSTSDSADALARLLHRLPPSLSMSIPSRRPSPSSSSSASTTTTSPPIISLSDPTPTLHSNLLSASQLGFFQLTNHSITSQLANAAESNSISLFNLPKHRKQSLNPKNWPLGYDADDHNDDGDDEESSTGESFILDSSCTTESTTELNLDDLKDFTSKMEKLGLELVEALACAVGFENPVREEPKRVCSLMWISDNSSGNNKPDYTGRLYPYAIGLQYQIRCQKYSLLSDSGWVSVSPQVDSVFITLGDIAQVWSNGKLKKVRGRPVPSISDSSSSNSITMSLLITLPIDSIVSPLLPKLDSNGDGDEGHEKDESDSFDASSSSEEWVFNSFSFEDYAWRVYHERLLFKDPLVRYRV